MGNLGLCELYLKSAPRDILWLLPLDHAIPLSEPTLLHLVVLFPQVSLGHRALILQTCIFICDPILVTKFKYLWTISKFMGLMFVLTDDPHRPFSFLSTVIGDFLYPLGVVWFDVCRSTWICKIFLWSTSEMLFRWLQSAILRHGGSIVGRRTVYFRQAVLF